MIPYGRQNISEEDIQSVVDVLRSDFITQGPAVERFEEVIASYVGAAFSIAVNSATSALHIACKALGLGEGDILWTSPNTFVASANCGLYCGAYVDFVDIDPDTYNMSVSALEQKLIAAEQSGRLPKVVIPVHFSGQSCDMAKIAVLSKQYGFKVIEDASHAIGASYQSDKIGRCRYSDITVFSFHPVKIVTTGEGGLAVTNSAELAEKMALLRSHGVTRDARLMIEKSHGPWYYQQVDLGFNYRMTDMQAALGASQMSRLDDFIRLRHERAVIYQQGLFGLPVKLPTFLAYGYSALHLYVIRLELDKIDKSHREVFETLRAQGIGVNLHYIPVHTQPYFEQFGFKPEDFPEVMQYYREAISIPMFPTMTREEQQQVVDAIKSAL